MTTSLPDWFDLRYLRNGSPRQRAAYQAIENVGVLERLAPFTPVLAGTIPLELDLPASDLDILCEYLIAYVEKFPISALNHLPISLFDDTVLSPKDQIDDLVLLLFRSPRDVVKEIAENMTLSTLIDTIEERWSNTYVN